MLSGMPKSLTCRSVGSGTQRDLGGHYICGRGAQVYSGGWMHFMSHGRGVGGSW
jgi:hypothetical protein